MDDGAEHLSARGSPARGEKRNQLNCDEYGEFCEAGTFVVEFVFQEGDEEKQFDESHAENNDNRYHDGCEGGGDGFECHGQAAHRGAPFTYQARAKGGSTHPPYMPITSKGGFRTKKSLRAARSGESAGGFRVAGRHFE